MADLRNASGTSCRLFPDLSGKVKGKAKSGRGDGKVISGTRAHNGDIHILAVIDGAVHLSIRRIRALIQFT